MDKKLNLGPKMKDFVAVKVGDNSTVEVEPSMIKILSDIGIQKQSTDRMSSFSYYRPMYFGGLH